MAYNDKVQIIIDSLINDFTMFVDNEIKRDHGGKDIPEGRQVIQISVTLAKNIIAKLSNLKRIIKE